MTSPTMTRTVMTTTEGQNFTLTTETKTPPLNDDATTVLPSNGTTMTSPTITTTKGQNVTLTTETKTPPLNDDATTVQSIPEGTTYPKTSEALNFDGTTIAGISTQVLTTRSCGLNCENNGELLKESCECLCQSGFAGVNCEVSTEKNPCTENPDLCPERGQYCESDTKITDGKEYVCKCNSLEGYVQKDGKCIEEEPFTTKLDVTRIDGIDATYKPAHRDINSAESRKVLDAVIPVIRMSLKNDPATETVIDVVGIRLENGSIGVTTMVIFPKEENVKEGDLTKVLKKEKLGNASVEIELKQEKFNVSKPQSAGCSSKYCSNDGTCRLGGVFPDLRPSCSCARDFYGPTCDSVVLTPFIIAMITFGTVAFLILAGVLVFCLFVRARGGRHKAGEKVSRADRLYASAWKTGPDILSHYLTEELDDKEADSETELSSVSDERMDQLVKDLKGSSFQMKRAKSVYQWESVKFNKPPSQPRYADNPSMLELKNSRDRRWYTSSNI
ncbi:uncharacterized protein LOC110985566 isoform X2 [Acanthaster planci]|uniref:Uncharacterized protein LOC110985566 isoform X2 n=1 Tax=Acanthaster planci TaxID=133434 RepID=A0A8B7ZBK6_ACAPL|nr:uncharacterized protein LOC110985566 isoform X2 [Acanthaster planci]